ncbi:Fanconi anemia group I protein homolog [Diabrotica virgifera virgifera]|uniref:Fanconi anemia group I protein n=1 Tax=Diabrotica virgifera virgifera TaxID=50390 RepID=A0ABM5KA78_DIAVI|nr:Fanconi anemia group I protein homolog [Diabrotica virgifera virgifera]
MSSLIEKIYELGEKCDKDGLEKLISDLDDDELVGIVKQNLCSSNFTECWSYILKAFKDKSDDHDKRIYLACKLLNELETRDLPQTRIDTIMNRLNLELPKFKSKDLAKLCSLCLEQVQSKKTIKFAWKDFLPEVLNVLIERETFTYEELDYTGAEYKSDFVNTICMSSWSPSIVTTLTTVFVEMPLTKEEHLKIVNKLGTYIGKLIPQEIPAFVYQLLRLCKNQNGKSIFLKLQSYFGLRIYNNANAQAESSPDSMSLDIIESSDNNDATEAESTVLYHIHTAASIGYECIKEYLNFLKNMVRAPEFVLHPFQLMVLFTISTISLYEETVFEIVRPAIVKSLNEQQRKIRSAWFRDIISVASKPEDVLLQVVQFSLQDRDLVLSGLVNFAFVLLEVGSALGRDVIAEKQWSLGNTILLKIIKRKRLIALTILQKLGDHIVTRQSVTQYIECLYILSRSMPLLMIENQSCIIELIECLVQVSPHVADQLLDALIPLMKVSPTIRDHMIVYLRKALYSRSVETRQMAVNGFLKLIKNLKISNMAVLSQSQNSMGSFSSGHSVFTQISLNKTTQGVTPGSFSNEALCFEILSILRRCFMQQADVRVKLYEGFFDAVCVNPELGIPVLDVIWFHLIKYYIMDESQALPLDFSKIVVVKEAQVVLDEPLGKLIHTIGLIVTKVSEMEEEKENNTLLKYTNVLDSLATRLSTCELVHFELDDGTNLLDIVPESQRKLFTLREAMSTYEALLGYKIYSWNKSSEKQGNIVNGLYQGYSRLYHFAKSLSNPKKADGKRKKVDTDKTTQSSQAAALKKESQKLNKNLKIPDTIWNFPVVKKALSLLHEPKLTWTTVTEANTVKTKKELHQHVMQATLYLVQQVKRRKDLETLTKKTYFDHVTYVASIIFKRIIKRLEEFVDFDSLTAALALECFGIILNLVNAQYKSNLKSFLSKVVSEEDSNTEDMITSLNSIVEIYQKIFERGEEELADDLEQRKLSLIAITTLNSLISHVPETSSILSVQMLEWLKNYAYNNTLSSKNSSCFINLFFETNIKYTVLQSLTLLENMSVSIGDTFGVITEEEHTIEKIKIVNEGTVNNILLSLCGCIKTILDDVDSVIARLKSEYIILSYPGEDDTTNRREKLKTKEQGVCTQLCFVVTILTNVTNLLLPPGNLAEAVFKSIVQLFGTLSSLTKYFNSRSSKINLAFQGARFERLVKLAGKQLAPTIYKFLLHLDDAQKEATQATQSTKKKSTDSSVLKSRVLRETRLIPKVVYEMEQFSKCIIQLSNKTKVDLSKYVGQGTARDFRILTDALNKDMENVDESTAEHDETATSHDDSRTSQDGSKNDETVESDSSSDSEVPPSKKSKK